MPESELCEITEQTVRNIVESQKPQLVVLTGDVVTYNPPYKGWKRVVDMFNDMEVPFVVTTGNHDGEYVNKPELYDYLISSTPLYIGTKGPLGNGDTAIEILDSDGNRPAAIIYSIDSNDYQPNKMLGTYDWIHFNQIEWYREKSAHYTAQNNGQPLPSLAFFHIPLQEYGEVLENPVTFGNRHEGAGAPGGLNTGMFASFVEMGDVMGVFVGHDHNNDFVGIDKGIALGFGRCTGAEAYGDLTRGGRMFRLYQDKSKFDTWVVTPGGEEPAFYYPSGLNAVEEQTMTYLPAIDAKRGNNGVVYEYYEGLIKMTNQIDTTTLVEKGIMPNFSIEGAKSEDHFGYKYHTLIDITERGVYNFYIYSDDGAVLYIDGQKVVDNDGGHSVSRAEGKVALEKGLHRLELDYFENYMGQELEVGMSSRNIPTSTIPSGMLFIEQ